MPLKKASLLNAISPSAFVRQEDDEGAVHENPETYKKGSDIVKIYFQKNILKEKKKRRKKSSIQ